MLIGYVHFPDSIREELSITLSQHLAGCDDSLPMSLVAAGKLGSFIVRQVSAIVNIEEVGWHVGVAIWVEQRGADFPLSGLLFRLRLLGLLASGIDFLGQPLPLRRKLVPGFFDPGQLRLFGRQSALLCLLAVLNGTASGHRSEFLEVYCGVGK